VSFTSQISDILHERTNYDFIGPKRRWFALSGAFILIGLVALLARGGLNLGIEFKGGTAWEVKAGQGMHPTTGGARDAVAAAGLKEPTVQTLGGDTVRVQAGRANADQQSKVREVLAGYAQAKPTEVSISDVGPTWGKTVSSKAIRALIFFFVAIAIYLSLRFEPKMAIAAILAVIHDILITVGAYAVTGFEVTPATVIAFLTILGFSLYDTVVVFDKVEENVSGLTSGGRATYSDVVNRSMNEVLMRSLNTSFVAVLPVFSLLVVGSYLLGALTIRDFALALFIGLLTGAYSSIFTATPLLALMKEREPRYQALRQRIAARGAAAGPTPAYAGVAAGDGGSTKAKPEAASEPAEVGAPAASPRPTAPRRTGPAPRPRQKRRRR
jgi:preprotein translocase subunit SecF